MNLISILILTSLMLPNHYENDPIDDGREVIIPVIFHVISTKKAPNVSTYITDELINKELSDLNQNFSATNDMSVLEDNFKSIVGNPKIRFIRADTILNAGSSKGVVKAYSRRGKYGSEYHINPKKYLNIFIGPFGSVTDVNGNRVQVGYKKFGNNSNTLTHELGHYFGLWHTWGKTNCKKFKLFSDRDDEIDDTPPQKNCTDLSRTKPCPLENSKNVNYNNFMDYNACRCMFTKGQVEEMRKNIITYRKTMYRNSPES